MKPVPYLIEKCVQKNFLEIIMYVNFNISVYVYIRYYLILIEGTGDVMYCDICIRL